LEISLPHCGSQITFCGKIFIKKFYGNIFNKKKFLWQYFQKKNFYENIFKKKSSKIIEEEFLIFFRKKIFLRRLRTLRRDFQALFLTEGHP
jgi:hypothetical protein